MEIKGFIGGSYVAQSLLADCEKTTNWYPEAPESQKVSGQPALYPTPGIQTLTSGLPTAQAFAHFAMEDREWAVVGSGFYEIDRYGVATLRGTVALGVQPATISSFGKTGNQLMVTAGGNVYIYTLLHPNFFQIAAMNGLATMGDVLDGYFLVLDANTGTLYWSDLLDGLTWQTGLNFAKRTIAPDGWVAMRVSNRMIWLFGSQTTEVWYDAGTFPTPFAPYPSSVIPYGIAAQFSVQATNGSIFWLGASKDGRSVVLQSTGFSPQVISTYPLSVAIQAYSRRNDAVGDSYTSLGHTFYLLSFPEAQATICYDMNTQLWHDRGTWIAEESRFRAWRPRFHAMAFDQHRMLDAETGKLYRMDESFTGDVDERPIRRVRVAPALFSENQRIFITSFEVGLEIGLGNAVDPGSIPMLMMRQSNDGGKTWGNENWRSAGKIGEYSTRAIWFRGGQGRRRVYEVSVSDGIPWRLTGVWVNVRQEQQAQSA